MSVNEKTKWLCAGVLAMGLAGTVPPAARAQPRDRNELRTRDREERIEYDELPWKVMDTLDDNLRRNRLGSVSHIWRGDRTWYQAVVYDRQNRQERILRISPTGELLTNDQFDPAPPSRVPDRVPDRRPDDRRPDDRGGRWEDSRVTATMQNPERVEWNNIPPRARAAMGREGEGQRMDYIIRYRDGNRVIYQVNVPDTSGQTRLIQVTSDGELVGEAEITHGNGPSAKPFQRYSRLQEVDMRSLPAGVARTVEREGIKQRNVQKIFSSTRNGRTFYTVQSLADTGSRWITTDPDGRIVSDVNDNSGR